MSESDEPRAATLAVGPGLVAPTAAELEARFAAVFRYHYAALCTVAFRFTRDRAAAEDLVQDILLTVWRRRGELLVSDQPNDLGAYLRVAVRHASLHALDRARTARRHAEECSLDPSAATAGAVPADVIAMVTHALSALPTRQRTIFELSRFAGFSYHQIAVHLAISVKTVETHMGRALRTLRDHLDPDRHS